MELYPPKKTHFSACGIRRLKGQASKGFELWTEGRSTTCASTSATESVHFPSANLQSRPFVVAVSWLRGQKWPQLLILCCSQYNHILCLVGGGANLWGQQTHWSRSSVAKVGFVTTSFWPEGHFVAQPSLCFLHSCCYARFQTKVVFKSAATTTSIHLMLLCAALSLTLDLIYSLQSLDSSESSSLKAGFYVLP